MQTIAPFVGTEQLCQMLIDGSHAIVRTVPGIIVWWSGGAARMYGWELGEAVGRSEHDLLQTVFPATLNELEDELLRLGLWSGELVHRCRMGNEIVVQSSWRLIHGKDGQPYVVEINNDITDVVRARERLARSEQRLQLAKEVGHLGIWDWDCVRDVAVCSEEWFAQHGREPRPEGPTVEEWLTWVHPEDQERFATNLEKARTRGVVWEEEYRAVLPNGSIRWLHGKAQPIVDHQGRCLRMVGINLDVTERKNFEERLQQMNRSLEHSNHDLQEFAYAAGHDLKEPLRAVSVCSELVALQAGPGLDRESQKYLELVREGAKRMQRMIDGLLEWARTAEQEVFWEKVSTLTLARRAVENLNVAIAESGAEISFEDLPEVEASPTALTQVFQNLIGNAIKYRRSEEHPRVRIGASENGDDWTFHVSDNGIGFDEREHERIFQLFRRIGNNSAAGAGIGLAVSRRAIERHGGRMWARSQPGVGSTFCFTIPKHHESAEVPVG